MILLIERFFINKLRATNVGSDTVRVEIFIGEPSMFRRVLFFEKLSKIQESMGILPPTISHQVYWTNNQRCQTESLPNSIILFSAIKPQKIWVVGFISTRAVVYNKQKDGGDSIVTAVA